jgi:hypothetical protein
MAGPSRSADIGESAGPEREPVTGTSTPLWVWLVGTAIAVVSLVLLASMIIPIITGEAGH